MVSMTARILIVDDDDAWRLSLTDALRREGFEVAGAATGPDALREMAMRPVDLLILDVQLPRRDGYDVCREVRAQPRYVPILMISGVKKEVADREFGLQIGADRYFEKPAEPREIIAQVRALLRMATALRSDGHWQGQMIVDDHLQIDFERNVVIADGQVAVLSPQEFALLGFLVRRAGAPCTRDDLIENVWGVIGKEGVSDAAINTMIARLRQKLEPDPHRPIYILTVHKWGYKFRDL
jgi:two-component system response regulator RegX3